MCSVPQVLCFSAYYQEPVVESRKEMYRVRHVKLQYYLEDDSIQINEIPTEDAGIRQGVMVKRHQIVRDGTADGECYGLTDLYVGNELFIYGKAFRLCDCDGFSRNFLSKHGFTVGEAEEMPKDMYTADRVYQRMLKKPVKPRLGVEDDPIAQRKLRQYLEHDREVLRFFCQWDDSQALYGDKLEFALHCTQSWCRWARRVSYGNSVMSADFLADDMIEVLELRHPNDGRDAFPALIKKTMLARDEQMVNGIRKQVGSAPLGWRSRLRANRPQ